jgi:glycosyltransferase involved in cell wall biosynthesis
MSDVTAVILSLGENYTERAIASVRRQSLPAAEMIVIRGISPFHRAFNSAVSRVRTEFFVQVDADMILDSTCIADLRGCMSERVGIVVGHLRDSLLGRIIGIKLFRKLCCDRVNLQDSLSSETDSAEAILKEGWTTIYPAKYLGDWGTFGEHRPDYNPHYTFCKFLRDGAKARYRRNGLSLRRVFRRLQGSEHKVATIATIGAAHGIFIKEKRDLHGPLMQSDEFEFLERFLITGEESRVERFLPENLLRGNLKKVFKKFYELGIQLRGSSAPLRFAAQMRHLQEGHSIASWVALVGVCHGLFFEGYDEAEAEEAFALLKDLLPSYHLCFRY